MKRLSALLIFAALMLLGACNSDGVITAQPEPVITLDSPDGIYTAPEREGLYQIYAQVRGNPEERANAFVIVMAEEVPDGPGGV